MRTTINLPEELIAEAIRVSHIKTKTQLFKTALENIIQKCNASKIRKYRGKLKLEIDLDVLRGRN